MMQLLFKLTVKPALRFAFCHFGRAYRDWYVDVVQPALLHCDPLF